MIQQEEILFGLGMVDEIPSLQDIEEVYKLDCIRKYMNCLGVNLMAIYQLFGLDYTQDSDLDGIGYMAIVPNSSSFPDNQVS